ncbi:MAG: TetR/AcrR family transcriptional regulator [Sporolactobacillus sp.]
MPPTKIDKEDILSTAIDLVRKGGLHGINARSLAAALSCSTKPIFRIYKNMEALKQDVIDRLNAYYNAFMEEKMNNHNRLLTQSIAYIMFARQEKQIFNTLFMNKTCQGASLTDILHADWNQPSIHDAQLVTGLSLEHTQCLFRDVWLYSHGIATQIVANEIDISDAEVVRLMNNAFRRFALMTKEDDPWIPPLK